MRSVCALLVAVAIAAVSGRVHAQTGKADGVAAIGRGDFQRAVEILKPIAENWRGPDRDAAFFMATLYESGRGVPLDELRACALYQQVAMVPGSPFAGEAEILVRRLFRAHGAEWFAECQLIANIGLDHRFEPATFTLGPGYTVAWTISAATVTYGGRSTSFPYRVASRGAVFLPLQQTDLAVGASRSDPLHFVEVFVWQPTGDKWALGWFLYEIFQGELSMAANEPSVATATGREPPATSSFDPRALIELRVNDSGHAEVTMLRTAQPRTAVIESQAEKHAEQERQRAHAAADARVDWNLERDPQRQPSMKYVDGDGCGQLFVFGWSEDRAEVITFRTDAASLHLSQGVRAIDIAKQDREVSLNIHVYGRAMRGSFCSDASGPTPPETIWRAVSGSVTIDLSPVGVRPRSPALRLATVRIMNAVFVSELGTRIRQTQPITLTGAVGAGIR